MDETGINRVLQREKGRAEKGKKVEGTKSGKRAKRVNTIGALHNGKYVAIKWYTHSTTSEFFEQWFEDDLLPKVPKVVQLSWITQVFIEKKYCMKLL